MSIPLGSFGLFSKICRRTNDKLYGGVNDTADKFIGGVVDTGD